MEEENKNVETDTVVKVDELQEMNNTPAEPVPVIDVNNEIKPEVMPAPAEPVAVLETIPAPAEQPTVVPLVNEIEGSANQNEQPAVVTEAVTPVPEQTPVEPTITPEVTQVVEETVEPLPVQVDVQTTQVEQSPAPTAEPSVTQTPVEPVATKPTAEPKKKSKLPIIVILIILLAAVGFAVWYFVLAGNENKSNNEKKEEPKQEETKKTKDEDEEKKDEGKKDSEKLTEEQVREIYERYHTKDGLTNYIAFESIFENEAYAASGTFNIKDLKEISSTFANYIYEKVEAEIKDKEKTYGEDEPYAGYKYYLPEDIEEILNREVQELFGQKVAYSRELFGGCHVLSSMRLNSGAVSAFEMSPQCGGTSNMYIKYEMTDFEQDGENLIVTEKVSSYLSENKDNITETTYRWTYTKYNDTYVIDTVERM